jgi:hypothetical protein
MNRYARRAAIRASGADLNTGAVKEAYEKLGCSVEVLTAVGGGVSDLLIGFLGVNHLREVKRKPVPGRVAPSAAKLRASQEKFAAKWRGEKPAVSREEADAAADVDQWCATYWKYNKGATLPILSLEERIAVVDWWKRQNATPGGVK